MDNQSTSRRSFVKKSLAITAGISIIPRYVMGGTKKHLNSRGISIDNLYLIESFSV